MHYYDNGQSQKPRPQGIRYTKSAIASDDLYGRIAVSKESQNAAQALLLKYGYEQAKTETDLAHKLASLVMNVGESALRDISNIHPDKELILSFYTPPAPAQPAPVQIVLPKAKSEEMNDCGCGGKHYNSHGYTHARSNASMYDTGTFGDLSLSEKAMADYNKYMKPALLISVSVILVAIVWKKM